MPSRRVSDPVDPESFFAFHLTWQPSRESPSAKTACCVTDHICATCMMVIAPFV